MIAFLGIIKNIEKSSKKRLPGKYKIIEKYKKMHAYAGQ